MGDWLFLNFLNVVCRTLREVRAAVSAASLRASLSVFWTVKSGCRLVSRSLNLSANARAVYLLILCLGRSMWAQYAKWSMMAANSWMSKCLLLIVLEDTLAHNACYCSGSEVCTKTNQMAYLLSTTNKVHIFKCYWLDTGFGLIIGFILLLELITTNNYNAIANLHTQHITPANTKSPQSVMSSLFRAQ
jgi:hypothetical protein